MNNILFFLTPKAMCAYLLDDYTVRQALEKMEAAHYAALPILNRQGEYMGTLTEGDVLWAMKNMCNMDLRTAETRRIMEISRKKDNIPVRVTTSMFDLIDRASTQNFVPVVDDDYNFIGILTRREMVIWMHEQYRIEHPKGGNKDVG
jgi:CBS-domain-containing membrane protein